MMEQPKTCWQCGKPTALIIREGMTRDDWFTCDWCGENLLKVSDALAQIQGTTESLEAKLQAEADKFKRRT